MGEHSTISWTHHTFNPWYGCTKVSPACDHCYAEGWAKRSGLLDDWGKDRRRSSPANWRKPLKWDAEAERDGVRRRVFCASLADVFDNQAPAEWRRDLFELIRLTPFLDWLLLTKRPQNVAKMVLRADVLGRLPDNVWLGTTAENQEELVRRRISLLEVPAAVHFLSCEPLLERVWLPDPGSYSYPIDWVICGGESGPRARVMDPGWARCLRDQCVEDGIAFFMKQMTKKAPIPDDLMVR